MIHSITKILSTLGRTKWLCIAAASALLLFVLAPSPASSFPNSTNASAIVAYNIDFEMDKAREEKTVEHYGEGIRDIVEDATENNVNNPDSKPTAQSTYEREGTLNDELPEQIGKNFSQEDLADMENSD